MMLLSQTSSRLTEASKDSYMLQLRNDNLKQLLYQLSREKTRHWPIQLMYELGYDSVWEKLYSKV